MEEDHDFLGVFFGDVTQALESIRLTSDQATNEEISEKHIIHALIKEFGNKRIHPKYSIPGFWGMKIDIDVCNGEFGIEVKMCSALGKANEMQRLIGQSIMYAHRQYNNLIVAVVGQKDDLDKPYINELEQILLDQDIHLSRIEVVSS